MGFSLFGNNANYGAMAAQNERGRQRLINSGLQSIDTVFGGGTLPQYTQSSGSYNPNTQYYSFSPGLTRNIFAKWNQPTPSPGMGKQIWNAGRGGLIGGAVGGPIGSVLGSTLGLFDSGDAPPDFAAMYPSRNRGGKLYTKGEDQTFTGFTPNFYKQREQDYYNYAMPQLADQYNTTKNDLAFGLANRGLSQSTAAQSKFSALNRQMEQNRQGIADQGISQANTLRTQVEQAKQNLISQLYQTADPAKGLSSAIDVASNFQAPTAFAPLTNMFGSLANQYYTSQLLGQGGLGGGMGGSFAGQPPVYYGSQGQGVGSPYNSVKN